MLKAWMDRLRQRGKSRTRLKPVIIPRDQHTVSRKQISSAAVKTLYRLHDAGHAAFLIGGGVRDVLLGEFPKDFDIATDATPEQVRHLFGSQCQVIGRRFRLAHVRWGREIIEVATFRAHHGDSDDANARTSDEGIILRDNVWGSIEEDAARRDFTINAIYYNIADFSLWDFAHGMADLKSRTLRLIGDPETRYREDPVRMLRAIRFAAKLDFTLAPETARPIRQLAWLLEDISSHRLYDETQKLFSAGFSRHVLPLLEEYGLFEPLFPEAVLHPCDRLWQLTADNTDARLDEGKSINPAFFIAALLWGAASQRQQDLVTEGVPTVPAWQQAAQQTLGAQQRRTAIPKHIAQVVRDIWEMQPRLEQPRPRQVPALVISERFRAAYDFLVLREQAGEDTNGMGAWWTRWQAADPGLHPDLLRQLEQKTATAGNDKPRRRRRSRKSGA